MKIEKLHKCLDNFDVIEFSYKGDGLRSSSEGASSPLNTFMKYTPEVSKYVPRADPVKVSGVLQPKYQNFQKA